MKKITLFLALTLLSAYMTVAQEVVVDQVNDAVNVGLIISFQGNNNNGVYSADDFEITESIILGEIDIEGTLSTETFFQNLIGLNIFIYEDMGGEPGGDPSVAGSGLVELINIPPSLFFLEEDGTGNSNFLNVQITEANGGEQITLAPGTYWICAFPTVDELYANDGANRWNWAGSTSDVNLPSEPLLIDPFDNFGADITSWANIPDLLGEPFPGLTFQIRDEELLSVDSNSLAGAISLFPNPTEGDLNINFSRSLGAVNVDIINVSGQHILTKKLENISSSTINTKELANGVYFAQISTNDAAITMKFVKI